MRIDIFCYEGHISWDTSYEGQNPWDTRYDFKLKTTYRRVIFVQGLSGNICTLAEPECEDIENQLTPIPIFVLLRHDGAIMITRSS